MLVVLGRAFCGHSEDRSPAPVGLHRPRQRHGTGASRHAHPVTRSAPVRQMPGRLASSLAPAEQPAHHCSRLTARARARMRLGPAMRSADQIRHADDDAAKGRQRKKAPAPAPPRKGHQDGREQVKHLQQHGEQPCGHHSPGRHQRAPSLPNPGGQGTGDAENGPSPTRPPQHPGAHAASRGTPDQAPAGRAARTTP